MERILIYSHDTYGLGHLRRCLRIASALVATGSARHVLIASGSPRATSFDLPPGVDVVKLPAVTKSVGGGYVSRTLGVDLADIAEVRGELVLAVIRSFRPDVFLVDHAPLGMAGELLPVLDALPHLPGRPFVVLGMREIIDVASKVEEDWASSGVWERLRSGYDAVVVYGDAVVTTTALELDLAGRAGIPVQHVGYVCPQWLEPPGLGTRKPAIVVTVGGGGDGDRVLDAYVEFLERSSMASSVRSVLVTGPFIEGDPVFRLVNRVSALDRPVGIVRFSDRMEALLSTAAGAVTMAGYNTVAELLQYSVPGFLVPRRTPRLEQWLRATRLAAVADLTPVSEEEVTVEQFESFVGGVLEGSGRRSHQLDLDGARSTGIAISHMLSGTLAVAE